jgi:hypothetical protein
VPETDSPAGHNDWVEVVIAIVLSIAGLMTSWCSYQAALWDGEQAAHYSRANALHIAATQNRLEADARRAVQVGLFDDWLAAKAGGEPRLAKFYEDRFPPGFKPAFDMWIAQHPLTNAAAPATPFTTKAYSLVDLNQAQKQDAQADAAFQEGQEANRISDIYTQAGVFLAMALFFGGIGQVFKIRLVRLGLLAIAIVSCLAGVTSSAQLPTLSPG